MQKFDRITMKVHYINYLFSKKEQFGLGIGFIQAHYSYSYIHVFDKFKYISECLTAVNNDLSKDIAYHKFVLVLKKMKVIIVDICIYEEAEKLVIINLWRNGGI